MESTKHIIRLFEDYEKYRMKVYKKCKNRETMHVLANTLRHESRNMALAGSIYTYDEINWLMKNDRERLKAVAEHNGKTDVYYIKQNQECAAKYMATHLPIVQKEAGIVCDRGEDCHCPYVIVKKYREKKNI